MKLVCFPVNIDLAKDKDFWASLFAFCFQFALRDFFLLFDVLFLGTAINQNLLILYKEQLETYQISIFVSSAFYEKIKFLF